MSRNKISTNRKNYFSWSRSDVDIIRLDHYYFNKNSALFMPVRLPDSTAADKVGAAALAALGIKSVASIFNHCEGDNRLRIVITGHADGSDDEGGIPERFTLSSLRAKVLYSLLAGRKRAWASAVFEKHGVEDYKLLLKYIHLNKALYFGKTQGRIGVIDPGAIDNSWNDRAERATRNFVVGFNVYAKLRKVESLKLSVVIKKIKEDAANRWPEEMWRAVFVLYENALARTLELKTKPALQTKREQILKFCDNDKPYIACGESVPLKDLNDHKKSNYEPEPGRGVETLFFNVKSVPGKKVSRKMRIICPASTSAAHVAAECPIFYKYHMKTTYFDHRNLDLDIYHLKFVYYDRVLDAITPVPAGLEITVSHQDAVTNAKVDVDAVIDHKDGVYSVKIPRDIQGASPRKNLTFRFKAVDPAEATKRTWVFTENADGKPKLVVKTDAEMAALSAADRQKYYDLPREWCSLNYWTRFEKYSVGDRYQKMMKRKGFKPYGSKKMTAAKPLIFSLDDIVLTNDAASNQNVRDKIEDNSAIDLSKHSRVLLLYPDRANDYKIKVHKPMPKEPFFSDVGDGFESNLIHDYWHDENDDPHPSCRVVVFCSDFYDIHERRTETYPDFDFDDGHVLGARAAMKHDAVCSGRKAASGWSDADIASGYAAKGAGNYRLHYHHDWGFKNNKTYSGLILYWNCRFEVNSELGGKKADKRNYIEKGMQNAMERINLKEYQLEKHTGPKDVIIKIFPLFEAKQDYKSGSRIIKRGGEHICTADLKDDNGQSNMGRTTSELRASGYADEPTRFPEFNNIIDYDGHTYNNLTGAHEFMHACGLDDEYLLSSAYGKGFPRYEPAQYYEGVPYSANPHSLMNKNRGTRMHQFWLYANWVNDAGAVGQPLNTMLNATKFKLALRGDGFDDLEFELTDANYKNIYVPRFDADVTYAAGATGKLTVYKLGGGEFANTLKAGEKFDGIMTVRTNIRLRFLNDTENWSGQEMIQWAQALDSDLKLMLKDKYYLKCDAEDHDFDKVFMYFLPHYNHVDPAPAGTHFKLQVKKNGNDGFNPDAVDKSIIGADNNVANKKIIRHLFGQFAGDADLTIANLSPIKDWIGHATRCNETFTIEDL
ncbi:MAG: hypothetical protein GY835_27705 [bacterium]|nr:hypothetical protein [bacterium]